MIVGLVSTYREGPLAVSAVRSLLPACDMVYVADGPVKDAPANVGEETDWSALGGGPVIIARGQWGNETEKRYALLERCRGFKAPAWGLTLDADELLLHGELIPDLVWSVEHNQPADSEHLGIGLRLVEWDGSVAYVKNRLLRLDRIVRNVYTWSQFQAVGQDPDNPTVLGNEPIWYPDAMYSPMVRDEGKPTNRWIHAHQTPFNRPPLQGEPHILHRSLLRPADRQGFRLHELESAGLDKTPAGRLLAP